MEPSEQKEKIRRTLGSRGGEFKQTADDRQKVT